MWILCSGSHETKIKVRAGLGSYPEILGKNLLQTKVHVRSWQNSFP